MDLDQSVDIMSTRDAAQCLGVSVRTVQLWVESGSLEAWKTPGGHRRIYRQSVDSMLAARAPREVSDGFFEVLIYADAGSGSDPVQMEAQLKSLGSDVRVRVAQNGFEALIQIGDCCPNLLIAELVVNQHHANGLQMLNALQHTAFMQTMQIIVVTDLSSESLDSQGGFPAGVHKLGKPILYPQLLRLVSEYMDTCKARQMNRGAIAL